MKEKIAYTVHPVSNELKTELIGKGYKIIDARFAKEGDKIFNQPEDKESEGNQKTVK